MSQGFLRPIRRGKAPDSKGEWKSAHHESKEDQPQTKRWKACHRETQKINQT